MKLKQRLHQNKERSRRDNAPSQSVQKQEQRRASTQHTMHVMVTDHSRDDLSAGVESHRHGDRASVLDNIATGYAQQTSGGTAGSKLFKNNNQPLAVKSPQATAKFCTYAESKSPYGSLAEKALYRSTDLSNGVTAGSTVSQDNQATPRGDDDYAQMLDYQGDS